MLMDLLSVYFYVASLVFIENIKLTILIKSVANID